MFYSLDEKFFALLCSKNIRSWGVTEKSRINVRELEERQKNEWQEYWHRFGIDQPSFSKKIVVDYGCGFGYDSLFALEDGAKHVYCLDVSPRRLSESKRLHSSKGFNNVTYIDNTEPLDLIKTIPPGTVDILFSRDVMEHVPSPENVLLSMYQVTGKGGEIYIGFSPLYKSPYGAHFKNLCSFPWAHLMFSEKTILNVFKKRYNLNPSVESYQDIEGSGVNKLSYFNFLNMLKQYQWEKEVEEKNIFADKKPVNIVISTIANMPLWPKAKELFIVNIYIKMRK